MAKKTTPAAKAASKEEPTISILVRPIDPKAKGSAAEWRELNALQLRLMRARQAYDGKDIETTIEFLDAVAAREAVIKARSRTSDGSSLDDAWQELSREELEDLYVALLSGGSTVVPPASAGQ